MLTVAEKIEIFRESLETKWGGYGDYMKNDIYFRFFEDEWDFKFLDEFSSKEEIDKKIELVVGRMIRHEHEMGLDDIMRWQFYG